ncbi:MAG: glycosyltransferase family 4 protein [Candidatus Zixiibacteriota bacterium]
MNLLFLDSVDARTFGGYENWILLTARHFLERGHRATVVGRPGAEYLRRASLLSDKIEVVELPIAGDFNPATIVRMRRLLQDRRIDLLTVNFNKDVRLGGLAARWYGRTKVCWRMGLDVTRNGWAHRYLSPRLVDGVMVCSHALKRQVTRHGYLSDAMVEVVHIGIEDRVFERPNPPAAAALRQKYRLDADSLVAVTVGRFVDQKGHIYLVEAAPEIVRRVPSAVFLLLGDGHLETLLRTRIAQLGLDNRFIFGGMLDNIDVELAGADLMIHPAVEEPASFAIVEGMRAGLPTVASRVGGIPEELTDGKSALLVPPCDSSQLAEAVIKMLLSAELRAKYSQATQQRWREEFRLSTMMRKVETYFGKLLER